jgi:hypothetical protein
MPIVHDDKCNPIHDTYIECKARYEADNQTIPCADILKGKKKGNKGHPGHYPHTVFRKGKKEENS